MLNFHDGGIEASFVDDIQMHICKTVWGQGDGEIIYSQSMRIDFRTVMPIHFSLVGNYLSIVMNPCQYIYR